MTDQTPTEWEGMSEAQAIVAALKRELPNADLEQLSDALVKVLNPKPGYSTLEKPALHTVKSAACGEFALGYYYDADRIDHKTKQKGTMMVALNKRPKNRGEFGGEARYACTGGGYMELA